MSLSPTSLRRLVFGVVGSLVVGAGIPLVAAGAQAAGPNVPPPVSTFTCGSTPAVTTYTVPLDITSLVVSVGGAQGGGGGSTAGGKGATAVTTLTVTPTQTLNIAVGCQPTSTTGGWGGVAPNARGGGSAFTGSDQFGGGGASQILDVSNTPLVVAGGGGGGGYKFAGGAGGQTGGNGNTQSSSNGGGGVGATQSAVGAGGVAASGADSGSPGLPGSGGIGGDGGAPGSGVAASYGGAGGGGGWFGGGGGGAAADTSNLWYYYGGSGGGGSSYSTGSGTSFVSGNNGGMGQITITPVAEPAIYGSNVTGVTADGALLAGMAMPINTPITETGFRYGTTPIPNGSWTSVLGTPATSSQYVYYNATLSGLDPGQQYYFEPYAKAFVGGVTVTSYGATQNFTTTGEPTVTTGNPIGALTTATSAVVSGTVEPNGTDTYAQVQYSTSAATVADGGGTPVTSGIAQPLTGSGLPSQLEVPLSGLQPNTTYYYRFFGTSTAGSSAGAVNSFTTTSSSANVTAIWPRNVVANRATTFKARVQAFGGGPLSGPAVVKGVDAFNRKITVCTMNVVNGNGSCVGTLRTVGQSYLDVIFTNASYTGDNGSTAIKVLNVSSQITKVTGKGSKRKVNVSGKTAYGNQLVTIFRVKSGKTRKIGTVGSNSSGNWSKKGLAIKAGGTVYIFAQVRKQNSARARV